ncbi:MAG: GTP cyclohydrolase MptA [Thermoplasmata archaeon]
MEKDLPDIQAILPKVNFKLTRVGVTNVTKQIVVKRPDRNVILQPTINLYVDLPSTKKGADMSRNVEIIEEIVENSIKTPCSSIEDLGENIVKMMSKRHPYATRMEVEIFSDYFLDRKNPSGKVTQERYRIFSKVVMENKKIRKMIGVTSTGISVCPCAMETVRAHLKERYPEYSDFLDRIPVPSHNQRNNLTILIEIPEGNSVEINDLIEIAEKSYSNSTYEILKRKDEMELVLKAHENPKFVEDVVREALKLIYDRYRDFPDDTIITVKSESEESIHKHNAFAERICTLKEIKEEENNSGEHDKKNKYNRECCT